MRPRETPREPGVRLVDRVVGGIGAAMIRLVLAVARLHARLTGSRWHG